METKYYIMATLVSLIMLLLLLSVSGCRTADNGGVMAELPHTPVDREGGAR